MENYIYHIILAISTFAITNIDDLLILCIYFSNRQLKIKHIVAGQYFGVLGLILVSLSGVLLKGVFSPHYLSFLGLIPIALGLKGFYHLFRKDKNAENIYSPVSSVNFTQVAAVTFANGGDNIGVYTPLFAVSPGYYIQLYVLIFIIMIAAWCLAGYYIAKHPLVKKIFSSYGEIILPAFLVLLGLGILFEV